MQMCRAMEQVGWGEGDDGAGRVVMKGSRQDICLFSPESPYGLCL